MRYVVLIAGPPCAGKTYFAQHRAVSGDIVLDRDAMSGPNPERLMRDRVAHVAAMTTGRAWVIRSAPQATAREELAHHIRADEVLVLLPPSDVLTERAQQRPDPIATHAAIAAWHRSWSPSSGDTVVTDVTPHQDPGIFNARMNW